MALPFAAVTAPTMAIAQTDPVTAILVPNGGSTLPEGAGATFTLSLNRNLVDAEAVTLPLTIGGTATRGTDYRIVCVNAGPPGSATCNDIDGNNPSITFNGARMTIDSRRTRRTAGPLRLEAIEDDRFEADETVTLRLGGGATKTMTITEAPSLVEVSFSRHAFSVREDSGLFQPILNLNKAPGRKLEVPLAYVDLTATSGTDYTPVPDAPIPLNGNLTFSPDIPIINNEYHEGDRTVRIAIDWNRLPAGLTVGSIGYTTVTITDDDPDPGPPGLVFDPAHLTWNESQGCGEFEYYDPSGNKIAGNTPQQRRQNALAANARRQTNQSSSRGASMELPASAPGPTYRVKLKTRPAIPVKVTVYDPNDLTWWGNNGGRTLSRVFVGPDRGASNGRNGAGEPTLTFTPSNWDQWQTVKVKVACTDHFPDAVPLEHRMESRSITGQGVRYGYPGYKNVNDKRWTAWVRVHEQAPPVEIVASGLPPAGETVTMAEGDTRDFKIRIGESMLPNGSSTGVAVHLFAEPVGNVIRATRRDGDPRVSGVLMDTMRFTSSNREQWVRLQAVGVGDTRLVISAERDFTWAHETQRHWSPEWPVRVELPGICGRTKAVRDAIVGRIPGVSHCRDVTPEHLAGIGGTLRLDNIGLRSVQAGDFDELTSLTRLELDRNQLPSLPAGIFDQLTSLTRLELYDNSSLAPLPAGIFDQLTKLEYLDMDNIGLTTLPAGIFDQHQELNVLWLRHNDLEALPDNIFHKTRKLHKLRMQNNPGVPFTPTANAGPDQTVSTGAQVTLSSTATGPWGDNLDFRWWQVDGPNSDTIVTTGVTLSSATSTAPTFTAPAAPTVLHFRLRAEPVVVDTLSFAGLGNSFAWVTITVGGGQGSPQQDALAAQDETPSCVTDALLADARLAASETWRTSPGHVERWSRVLAAFGVSNAWSNNPMTVAEAQAQADRGLKRWMPVAPALECLAAAPEEQPAQAEAQPATPATPELSLSAGSAVDEGGNADFTVTADPAPATDLTITWTVAQSGEYLDAPGAGSRTVTLKAGTTSVALSVATVDDAADEADGSVSVTLGASTDYTVATGKGTATVAVRDDDEPVVHIAAGSGVVEGTSASFTVSASPVPAAPLDVTVSVAQSGDFAASGETGARTVTVPTSGSVTYEVATVDDGTEEPDGAVTATVDAGTGYTVAAAPDNAATVAVSDNDAPTSGPTISIADATMKENQRNGYFTVTLSEKVAWPVHVYYATRDSTPVSAVAGQDYLAWKRSWRLRARFRPGQTETQIHVVLYNDSHDEDAETFEMVLSEPGVNGPEGVSVSIADAVAVGTITNSDPMPAAWLSRFGRTTAEQALDGIAGRIAAQRSAGMEGTLAGRSLKLVPGAQGPADATGAAPGTSSGNDALAHSAITGAFGDDGFGHRATPAQALTMREALLGSHFTATGETDASGGSVAMWGRAAQSRFDGHEGSFSLDGEATTAMLGADYARGNWLVGTALMQSAGEGGYADTDVTPRAASQTCPEGVEDVVCSGAVREGDGTVEASLTAAVPYAALEASERLKVWGAAGYGSGEVTLKPAMGGALASDITWTMAAAGARSALLRDPGEGSGLALALTSDALWARTRSEKTHELSSSDSDVTRLRLGLEGSWRNALEGGGHFTPKLEAGMRHDGGDAETGFGVELGGGLAWSAPTLGLNLDVSGRTLLAHDDDDLKDRGFAASMAFDPDPASERGPSLSLGQSFGAQAQGGLDALFAVDPLEDRTGAEAQSRWTAEAAWGFAAFGGRFTGSPHAGLGLSTGTRDYTLGWRVAPAANGHDLSFGVRATRYESDAAAPTHGVGVELEARW